MEAAAATPRGAASPPAEKKPMYGYKTGVDIGLLKPDIPKY